MAPQLALGLHWQHNEDFNLVPKAVGAEDPDGLDVYLVATKLWLDGPFDHTWIADMTLRASAAKQLGILGLAVTGAAIICSRRAIRGRSSRIV